MAKVTYKPIRSGLEQVARSSEVGSQMVAAAESGRRFAEGIAPVGPTGNYRRSFRVRRSEITVPGGRVRRVAGAVLENTAPHAGLVEWHNRSFVLTRTMAHIEQENG